MALSDLIDEKSRLLLKLEANKHHRQPPDDVRQLANRVAELEAKIAEQLLAADEKEKATVNLVSQASCLVDAGRLADAIVVYRNALAQLPKPNFRQWVES